MGIILKRMLINEALVRNNWPTVLNTIMNWLFIGELIMMWISLA
jgi:hypothetical protein